ncbi:FtsX-like permease family protein [Methylobacterium planeticum]|uniref:FtsX-like permease family protein n=1 Tax=Methylobacterium planeticum TaxID=2615211 RepID=A0A6N6MRP7_9HYPH|nr:FtsX-like permease family protein [Methylobacterium planeticum]KAB1073466.1 FtsX-like permease family protein [Methylobacterium planeticum]
MTTRLGQAFQLAAAARLAYRQLTHRGAKLLAALLGVMVAVVLMFTQLGFKGALYDSGVAVAKAFDGEIVLASPDFQTMSYNPPWMPRGLLYEARGVAGVRSASPLYASTIQVANPSDGNFLTTWLYAFDPNQPVLTLPDVNRAIPLMRQAHAAIIDRHSRYELGDLAARVVRSGNLDLVLPASGAETQYVLTMVGSFEIGPTISADGTIITSDLNFYRYLHAPLDRVSLGIVRVADGADPVATKQALQRQLGPRARIFLKDEFIANEINFYAYRTPIGFIFNVGLAVGVFVGIVFISQVLHGIIADNVREYAALRAIGYDHTFFRYLVAFIAVALAVVTYLPSIAVTLLIYHVAASVTKLPLDLKSQYLVAILAIVVAMGLTAAIFSAKKLRRVDPVDLF